MLAAVVSRSLLLMDLVVTEKLLFWPLTVSAPQSSSSLQWLISTSSSSPTSTTLPDHLGVAPPLSLVQSSQAGRVGSVDV